MSAVLRLSLSFFFFFCFLFFIFFLMMRRPPRSALDRSSAASDVYKRQPSPQGDRLDPARPVRGPHEAEEAEGARALPGKRTCLLYTSPSPRDRTRARMPSSA